MILLTSKTTKLDILQENVKAAFLRRTDICVGAVGLAIRGGVGKTSGDEGHKPCTRASDACDTTSTRLLSNCHF
jgi:hypothetical protein